MPSSPFSTPATYYPMTGRSLFGEATFGSGVPVMVAVIKTADVVSPSPIRSEASTSHGRVDQSTGIVTLLFPPGYVCYDYDRVDVIGLSLEIISVYPRADWLGRPDHVKITCRNLAT